MSEEKNKKLFVQKPVVMGLLASFCCLLWGSAFPCIKIGYQMMAIDSSDTASQLLYAGYRFMLAGVFAIIIGCIVNRRFIYPKKSSWSMVVKLSMFQTVGQYILFYIGLAHTTGVKASILDGANTFLAILVACLIFHYEKLTLNKLIGCIVGFIGVIIVNLNGSGLGGQFTFIGDGFILLSAACYALSSTLVKKYSLLENPVTLSGYQFCIGGFIIFLTGKLAGGDFAAFTPASLAMLIYLAMVSAVAYSIWGILLKYNPVGKISIYGLTNPVFGVILSAMLLNEQSHTSIAIVALALLLVCIGIYIVNRENE